MEAITDTAFIDADGKLKLTHADKFTATVACYPNTAGTVTFQPHSNGISHNQRKYFYGVIVDLLHAFFVTTGERPENILKEHVVNLLKDRFLFREEMCPIMHKYIKVYISLSDSKGAMTHKEYTEKKEAIQQWAMETFGLEIPEPDKNWRMYKKPKEDGN